MKGTLRCDPLKSRFAVFKLALASLDPLGRNIHYEVKSGIFIFRPSFTGWIVAGCVLVVRGRVEVEFIEQIAK